MSRGHGRVQEEIIRLLMDFPCTINDLAGIIYQGESKNSLEKIRRALKPLEAQKIAKRHGFSKGARQCWCFNDVNVDRTGERLQKLRGVQRLARKPRLVKG